MKAGNKTMLVLLSMILIGLVRAAVAKDYAEAERRIDDASAQLTGMGLDELSRALARDWPGKKKEDLVRWFDTLPKRLDGAWTSKKESPEAIVIRISTEYPVDREFSAVFRFWLSTAEIVDRVQFYREGARKEANQTAREQRAGCDLNRMCLLRSTSPVVQKGSLHARPPVSHR